MESLRSLRRRSGLKQTARTNPRQAPRVVLTWGTNGHGDGEFDIPIAVAVNQKDEILVTDFRQSNAEAKSRVQRFDRAAAVPCGHPVPFTFTPAGSMVNPGESVAAAAVPVPSPSAATAPAAASHFVDRCM